MGEIATNDNWEGKECQRCGQALAGRPSTQPRTCFECGGKATRGEPGTPVRKRVADTNARLFEQPPNRAESEC